MKRMTRCCLFGALGVALLFHDVLPARDKKGPDKVALERTREQVKMLDDLYKTAVVSITNNYTEGQASVPAAIVAMDVFTAMQKKGYHTARLIDATGKPKNKANVAKTESEQTAVAET